MAKAAAHESSDEDMEDQEEEVFEVKRIKKHKRETDENGVSHLFYNVAWEGYPDPSDDTWEPEANVTATALDIVDKYWQKVPATKQYQRFDPASAKGKAAARRKSRAESDAPSAATPAKGRRASAAAKEPSSDDEDDDAPVKPASKRKGRQSGASAGGSSAKKHKKAASPEPESDADEVEVVEAKAKKEKKKAGRKSKSVEPEEEEDQPAAEDEEEEIPEGDGYDGSKTHVEWDETEYAGVKKWDNAIEAIETVEKDDNGFKFYVVWKDLDNVASWVPNEVCRDRCALKLLDFYENHLRFQTNQVDGSDQEDN